MTSERTAEGKVVLFEHSTGRRLTLWPVDARVLLESGGYTADTLETGTDAPAAPVIPTPEQPPEKPAEHALGVPLAVTQSQDAPPGKPLSEPVRSKSKRGGK